MAHARQQIREAVATLVGNLATSGARVYQSRVHPLQDAHLPGLRIWTLEELSERDTFGATNGLARSLALVIEACAKATADLDDTLDTICAEVEAALAAAPTLSGKAKDLWLEATEIELTGEGEQPVGIARMTWRVMYRTATTAPTTAI